MPLLFPCAAACLGCRTPLVGGRAVPHTWVHVDRTGTLLLAPEEQTHLVYDTEYRAWADLCLHCAVRFLSQSLLREVERRVSRSTASGG